MVPQSDIPNNINHEFIIRNTDKQKVRIVCDDSDKRIDMIPQRETYKGNYQQYIDSSEEFKNRKEYMFK